MATVIFTLIHIILVVTPSHSKWPVFVNIHTSDSQTQTHTRTHEIFHCESELDEKRGVEGEKRNNQWTTHAARRRQEERTLQEIKISSFLDNRFKFWPCLGISQHRRFEFVASKKSNHTFRVEARNLFDFTMMYGFFSRLLIIFLSENSH